MCSSWFWEKRLHQRYHLSDKEKEEYRCNHKQIAPDLIDGVSNVSTASDMYSYGRLLKNIILYFPLSVELISTHLKKAIKQCLKYNDFDRPSAAFVCQLFWCVHKIMMYKFSTLNTIVG